MVGKNKNSYKSQLIYFILSLLVVTLLANITMIEGNNGNFPFPKNTLIMHADAASQKYIFVTSWNNSFNAPSDIAADPSGGFLYVVDSGNNRIQKFDSNGYDEAAKPAVQWGTFGPRNGEFINPTYIALDSSGRFVYVADSGNNRVQKFDSNGKFIAKWGSKCNLQNPSTSCIDPDGSGPLSLGDGQFNGVAGIATDKSGYIYVADPHNHRIQKFDSNGKFIAKWGSFGRNDGQFRIPSGVAIDPSGKFVYVADTNNNRIQKFDSTGKFIVKWNTIGANIYHLNHPLDLSIDPSGKFVYVADTDNNQIEKFDTNGSLTTQWGSECSISDTQIGCIDPDGPGPLSLGDGQFNGVGGISFDPSGTFVYAVDLGNNRVQVFSVPPTVNLNNIDNRAPKWDINTVNAYGNSSYTANSYAITIDWGDGSASARVPISGDGSWGPVPHIYSSSAISSNPNHVMAKLVNSRDSKKANSKSIDVDVQKHETYIDVRYITQSIPWGGPTLFSITLLDLDGHEKAIPSRTIHFRGNGMIGIPDGVTNSNGLIFGRGKAPDYVTYWNYFSIDFDGDSSYNPQHVQGHYETTKHDVSMVVSPQPRQVPWGAPFNIIATLSDKTTPTFTPLFNKTILFAGRIMSMINGSTDANGKADVTTNASSSVRNALPIVAIFGGDDLYAYLMNHTNYNSIEHSNHLTLSISPSQLRAWESYNASGYLMDATTQHRLPLKDVRLFDISNNIQLRNATTDSTGRYQFTNLKAPTSPGVYVLQAWFNRDPLYFGKASPQVTLTVR